MGHVYDNMEAGRGSENSVAIRTRAVHAVWTKAPCAEGTCDSLERKRRCKCCSVVNKVLSQSTARIRAIILSWMGIMSRVTFFSSFYTSSLL